MNAKLLTLAVFGLCFELCSGACNDTLKNKHKKRSWCSFQNVDITCEFSFEKQFGYTCRVGRDFESRHKCKNAVNVAGVRGNHTAVDRVYKHTNNDVLRVMFYDHVIHYIPANLTSHLPRLRTLQIKRCGLRELTRPNGFHALRRLYLGFNELESIPATYFWHFCRLEVLSLHGNRIASIPQMAFRDLNNLKRLSLHGNRLKTIDPLLFGRCLDLEFVDLDNNALRSLEGALFANLTRLHKVSVRHNRIQFIDGRFLSTWQSPNAAIMSIRRYALLENNTCIDFVLDSDSNFREMQEIILENCSVPVPTPPPPPKRVTPKQTCKKKYKVLPKLYFDYCQWHIRKGFEKLFKHSF